MAARALTIRIPGGNIAAKTWGPNAEDATRKVLAIHGWLDNAGTFDGVAPLLNSDIHLTAIDLPGQGMSDHKPEGSVYHFMDWVLTIHDIAEQLKWETFTLLGHSMGAGISSLFASTFPEKIEKLVMLDGGAPIARPPSSFVDQLRSGIESQKLLRGKKEKVYPSREACIAKMQEATPTHTLEACQALAQRGVKPSADGKGFVFSHDILMRTNSFVGISSEQIAIYLKRINCPTMMVLATEGALKLWPKWTLGGFLEHIQEGNPNEVQLHHVSGDHHVHLTHPERVAPLLNGFFNETLGGVAIKSPIPKDRL